MRRTVRNDASFPIAALLELSNDDKLANGFPAIRGFEDRDIQPAHNDLAIRRPLFPQMIAASVVVIQRVDEIAPLSVDLDRTLGGETVEGNAVRRVLAEIHPRD